MTSLRAELRLGRRMVNAELAHIFTIRHSSFVIRHSSFAIRHSPFVISVLPEHAPLVGL